MYYFTRKSKIPVSPQQLFVNSNTCTISTSQVKSY